jgi:hypothetical protein
VRITAGGQNLRGAREVFVSGEGVTGKVVGFARAPWLLKTEDRRVVAQYLRRLASWQAGNAARGPRNTKPPPEAPEGLPDHPMLKKLDKLSPRELRRIAYEYLDPARRSQLSAQIAETVTVELTVAPDAAPGDRELRLRTPGGLTNPVLFEVGTLPEYDECEPNDYRTTVQPPVDVPCVFNGQVSFKDLDRFRFRARKGDKLVIDAQARRLVPYLADAVPGWFQAVLAVRDDQGNELAFADDNRFDPDPVLHFEVPADGFYVIEIRDAIHRGRADFVYRITVAERPFVRSIFPLGGRAGSVTPVKLEGWNLESSWARLDTAPGAPRLRKLGRIPYAVDDLPECDDKTTKLTPPVIVNGRIAKAGEVDRFRFEGRTGQEIVAEVEARRLGTPLDSLLRITDASGRVVAWNDDHPDPAAGLVTHQADSYVHAKLPADGAYFVTVADAQGHGGPAFAYRLRLGTPRPDFTVLVTPASINIPATGLAEITVHAVRRDGFTGPIELSLRDAPRGFVLGGRWIPAGVDKVRMTLAGRPQGRRRGEPIPLRIVAHALIDAGAVEHDVVPAEDMMQAFGLRHLVPAERLMVDIARTWRRGAALRLEDDRPVRIPAGGTAEARILAPTLQARPDNVKVAWKLDDPPAGVALRSVSRDGQTLVLVLAAEPGKAAGGLAGNLIVTAHIEITLPPRGKGKGKAAPRKQRIVVPLPAVPFVVVGSGQGSDSSSPG